MTSGIEFTARVTAPADPYLGRWHYVQVCKPNRKKTTNDNIVEYIGCHGKHCLDWQFPYNPTPCTAHPGTAGSWSALLQQSTNDTPSAYFGATHKHCDVDKEEFWMYVMFLPTASEARYVPLKKVYWWWEASATKDAEGVWGLDEGSANQTAANAVEATDHPTWVFKNTDDTSYYANGSLTITLPEDVTEGGGTAQATVSVMANVTSNLTVNLTSSDISEITVPATITITTGNKSVNFNITIVNDATKDGTQTTFVTATATGYANGKGAVAVRDNE